ncbi:MAG: tRNA (adenosine(37)-N6)-threonylcarbamoyltransferase complex transferase subunit TsaD [Bacillota bacterium]
MLVLGIESSCDETAVALIEERRVRVNLVASQLEAHRPFGGVVPELAARMHLEALRPLLTAAFAEAGVEPPAVDLVCATRGPGLIGALLVGFSAAKAMAWALGKPFIGVNHVLAHIYANFLGDNPPVPPLLCLVVSGGHTDLFYLGEEEKFLHLGGTRDDAAGECLDKAARLLGLGYPGGPAVEEAARRGQPRFHLPRPIIEGRLEFSFSGLKTALANLIRRLAAEKKEVPVPDLAASLQQAVVEGLVAKLRAAAELYRPRALLLAGGVAANGLLRQEVAVLAARLGMEFHVPPPALCTDNAAMVACAGLFRYRRHGADPLSLGVDPALDF